MLVFSVHILKVFKIVRLFSSVLLAISVAGSCGIKQGDHLYGKNLKMSGNFIAARVQEMSGNLAKVGGKILSGKMCHRM